MPVTRYHHFRFLFLLLCVAGGSAAGQTLSDPSWGYSVAVPSGWQEQHDATAAVMGHERIAGMILVMPHRHPTLGALRGEMQGGLAEEDVELSLTSGLRAEGKTGLSGEYGGVFRGDLVKVWLVGSVSPAGGGGAYVMAISTPEAFSRELADAARAVAKSMRYATREKPDVGALAGHFAGRWVNSTRNTETTVTLFTDGRFAENYEAGYSGTESGDWGLAREDKSGGTWSVRGTKESGTIVLQYANGERYTIEYRVHVEGGEVYWREYWFNGSLYGKR